MARAKSCSSQSVASLKSFLCPEHRKHCNTENPEIQRCPQLVSKCEQAGNRVQAKPWMWLSLGGGRKVMVGSIAIGRAGICYFPSTRVDKAQVKERQQQQKPLEMGAINGAMTRCLGQLLTASAPSSTPAKARTDHKPSHFTEIE